VLFRYTQRAREELRRLAESRRYIPARSSRSNRHLQELDSAQEDQLHSAVNQAIHGQNNDNASYVIYDTLDVSTAMHLLSVTFAPSFFLCYVFLVLIAFSLYYYFVKFSSRVCR